MRLATTKSSSKATKASASQGTHNLAADNPYRQIIKASSIIGGAQGVNLLLGMVRVKFAAVLIGTIGVGVHGNYSSILSIIATISGMGIQSSALREVAQVIGKGDDEAIGKTVLSLRRVCWLTGLLGAASMVILSPLLSQWTFGSDSYVLEIALLSPGILLGSLMGGQTVLIQGAQRTGDLARINIIGSILGTPIVIGLYVWLGMRGILPGLILMGIVQFVTSWYFVYRVPVMRINMSWGESIRVANGMLRMGLVFMWDGLIVNTVSYVTRSLITQVIGLGAVGIYGSAYALSGMFVGFILGAMGTDFFPRLSVASPDHAAMNRLVNAQIESVLLLAMPGLLGTLYFAPWIIKIFYTAEFMPAINLLQWFTLGCFVRILVFPISYIMLSLRKEKIFFISETFIHSLHLLLVWLGLLYFGVEGVAIAFCLMYACHMVIIYGISRYLTGFQFTKAASKLMYQLMSIFFLSFIMSRMLPLWSATIIGFLVMLFMLVFCLRELVVRIGKEHRIVRMVTVLPGLKALCGI